MQDLQHHPAASWEEVVPAGTAIRREVYVWLLGSKDNGTQDRRIHTLETMLSFLREIPASLRPADVVDILLAAGFIYALIHWIRQSTSPRMARRIVVAVIVLAALYATARRFEMVLLETLVVLSLVLVGLGTAVFFQKDIQRMLDRFLLVRFRRRSSESHLPLSPVGMLCEAAGTLAAKRQGALIAIRGRESWSRQIEGGVQLEGLVSLPLLLSIFDPDSAGHDGAVLIEGEVITHFGAHLPLSVAGTAGGTRHAAGLGLSEQTDALVVIVSEERGSISLARRGKLVEVASAAELERLLAPFWEEHYTDLVPLPRRWKRLRLLMAPLLSLTLAFLLWLLFAYRPEGAIQTFTVPIEYVNVPPELELVNPVPVSALVTLSGSEQAFQIFESSTLLISMDLSAIVAGPNRLPIPESSVRIPRGWKLYHVEPAQVVIRARRRPPPRSP